MDRAARTFREALAATLAKSPGGPADLRPRLRPLLLPRRRARRRPGGRARDRDGRQRWTTPASELNLDALRQQIAADDRRRQRERDARPRAAGDRRLRPAGRGLRRASASTCSASAARSACAPSRSPSCRQDDPRARGPAARRHPPLRGSCCARSSSAAQIERTETLPPARPLNELDRALPSGPLQDLAAVHRVVAQLKRRLKTQGHEQRGRKRHAHVDVRRTMRASLETGGVPVVLKYRPVRPRRPELFVLCDVSTSVTSASVFFLSVLHALHDSFRKMRSFVFIERISEVTDVFSSERDFKAVSEAIGTDAGVADISGYTDYGRVWREFRDAGRGRPAPARDGDRARRRAHQRPRPARRRLRRRSPRRPAAPSGSTPSRGCTGTTATRSSTPTSSTARRTSAGRPISSRTSSRR